MHIPYSSHIEVKMLIVIFLLSSGCAESFLRLCTDREQTLKLHNIADH